MSHIQAQAAVGQIVERQLASGLRATAHLLAHHDVAAGFGLGVGGLPARLCFTFIAPICMTPVKSSSPRRIPRCRAAMGHKPNLTDPVLGPCFSHP